MTRMLLTAALVAAALPATASAKVSWFHSPSGNIECEVASNDSRGTYAYCQTFDPVASVKLNAKGASKVCHGASCVGDGPPEAFTLGYGKAVKVGIFRCTSRTSGMTCRVIGKGHGFTIARAGIRRF
ncbi:MAG: hypothetical protein JWM73_140 [Solirubrobacterales bacterium]|jgi:hypothetical protein|nr:hypothetical protein [Solirubrobacterales bacterium]